MKVSDLTEPVQVSTCIEIEIEIFLKLVSWHETVEGQDSCTCKLLKPFNGIKHVKITGYKTLMKIYVDKLCKYSKVILTCFIPLKGFNSLHVHES
jgi:hypothetical protein